MTALECVAVIEICNADRLARMKGDLNKMAARKPAEHIRENTAPLSSVGQLMLFSPEMANARSNWGYNLKSRKFQEIDNNMNSVLTGGDNQEKCCGSRLRTPTYM